MRWGSRVEAAGDEQAAEAVVVAVAEAAGDAAVEFDQAFIASVGPLDAPPVSK